MDPLLAVAIGSSLKALVGYQGASALYSAQKKYMAQLHAQNKKAATQAFTFKAGGWLDRLRQENEKTAGHIHAAGKKAMAAYSTARVAAGQAGVAGTGLSEVLGTFVQDELNYAVAENRSNLFMHKQIMTGEMEGLRGEWWARVASSVPKVQQKPDPWAYAFGVGADVATAYAYGLSIPTA